MTKLDNREIISCLMTANEVLNRSRVKPAGFRSAMANSGDGWGEIPDDQHELALEWWQRLMCVTDEVCREAL